MNQLPFQIQEIIAQMGGLGMTGAFIYVGGAQLAYKARPEGGYPDPSRVSKDTGLLDYQTGLTFRVNGKRGRGWTMAVTYEPTDTYTVYLMQLTTPKVRATGKVAELLDYRRDVYCDELQAVVERMYDEAIKKHNGGFIPC